MPYEYRKLSPKEREQLIMYRSARGYPRHSPPHPFRTSGAYLISAANFEHEPILESAKRRTEFETLLLSKLKEIADDLIAWVILPNHYHFLSSVQSLDFISSALNTYIRNDTHLHLAFNYIHYNPVKHGYISDPYDWNWSSLQLYYADKGKDWLRDQWKSYTPPLDFGKGWDDQPQDD